MTSAFQELLSFADQDDPYAFNGPEIEELALTAGGDRFEEQRERIPALHQRASEVGTTAIRQIEDLVPLLLSHTTYKSYPASFVEQRRWDRLAVWLGTVSAAEVRGLDFTDVEDIDGWIERLQSAGHFPMVSSGTTGKSSFLYNSADDLDRVLFLSARQTGWPGKVLPFRNDRIVISLMPGEGATAGAYGHVGKTRFYARPGEAYCIRESPRLADMSRIAATRRAIASGTATPAEVAAFEAEARQRAERMTKAVAELADLVIAHRREPVLFAGLFAYAWQVMQRGLELGIPDGEFNSETVLGLGGGLKGATLPDGWWDQMQRWFAPARPMLRYGMSEISSPCQLCESGFYHVPPWLILLMVDESGEALLPRVGQVTGRVAFYDPMLEGRWGGIVSGDKATAHFGGCECGRPGPVIESGVVRYGEGSAGADDKLSCSASVEAYVRDSVGE